MGDNAIDAQKAIIRVVSFNQESGFYNIQILSYYWSLSSQEWQFHQSGEVKLKGNELIDGTMKASITKLTDTDMTTYQKDQDGETYITYTKLL